MTRSSTRQPKRTAWWRRLIGRRESAPATPDLTAENARLRRAVAELSMVNDVAREIAGSFDSEQVIDRILHRARKAVQAEQAAVVLIDDERDGQLRTLVRSVTWHQADSIWHLDQRLLGWMATNRRPLLSNQPRQDPDAAFADVPPNVRHLLCVPLLVGGALIGVLTAINHRDDGGFGEDDARLLTIISSQSAQVLEAARLYEHERKLADVEEELRAARRIQRHLLPAVMPAIEGFEVAASLRSAGAVGGDVYDIVPLADGRWAFAVIDVSGNGVPAALLAANLHAALRSSLAGGHEPGVCLRHLDRHLREVAEHGDFATCFLGILDPAAARFTHSVAGHEPGLLVPGDGRPAARLATGDPLLGVLPDPAYHDDHVDLAAGDVLAICTDGLTDRFDGGGDRFGSERLIRLLRDHGRDGADALVARIVAAIDEHGAGSSHQDDEALLVIRRTNPEPEELA
jgi:sigma-B regulation protein RsbU (phosphoserine phosphatase)